MSDAPEIPNWLSLSSLAAACGTGFVLLWNRINGVSRTAIHAKNNRAHIELAAAEKYSTKADMHELGDRLGARITELRDDIHRGRAEMMQEIRALAEQRKAAR